MVADDKLLNQLGSPATKTVTKGTGGATSIGGKKTTPSSQTFEGAAGLGDFFKGIVGGASNLLNYVLYYQMKDRAGVVGRAGVNRRTPGGAQQDAHIRVAHDRTQLRARVVTAAVTGDAPTPKGFVHSLSLLQGAFSHYSFSDKYDDSNKPGFYRTLISESRVSGPMIITHTRADNAVGLAYAIASRAAGQIAAAVGDKNDPYGGLGSNGAQKTTEVRAGTLPKAGGKFDQPLAKATVTNLLADGLIKNHSDVANPNAAYAVLNAAIAAGV